MSIRFSAFIAISRNVRPYLYKFSYKKHIQKQKYLNEHRIPITDLSTAVN